MMEKKTYANGQAVYALSGDTLSYYFKNGVVKAEGRFVDGLMEDEWRFFRGTGQLWQTGHFLHNKKHGSWVRLDLDGREEYREEFIEDKKVKK
jgi:antitoxin component YwqK of YwqJK toxin-antitoxin module